MEKTEWPTRGKVKELRSQGVFPYSAFTTFSVIAASLLLACLLIQDPWLELLSSYRELLRVPSVNEYADIAGPLGKLLSSLRTIAIILSVSVIIAALMSILAQSRFLISSRNFGINFGRINPFASILGGGGVSRFLRGLLCWVFALLAGAFFLWWNSYALLGLLNKEASYFHNWALLFYKRSWPVLLVFFIFSGAVSYWIVWYSFMRRHRMSTKELEGDQE